MSRGAVLMMLMVVCGACCVLDGRFDVLLSFCLRTSDGNGIGGMGRTDNDGIDALLFVANGKHEDGG